MNCTIIPSQRANQFRTHQTSWIKQETSSFGNIYSQKQLSMEYQLCSFVFFKDLFISFCSSKARQGVTHRGLGACICIWRFMLPSPPWLGPRRCTISFLSCRNGLGNTECYVWNVLSSYMRSLLKLGLSSSLLNRHLSSQLCPPKLCCE